MGHKLRLSVHRKNEFRKKRAKKRRYKVTVRESLPLDLLKISIPKDKLLVSSINERWGIFHGTERNGNGTHLNDTCLVLTFHMTDSTDISRWCLADYPSQSFQVSMCVDHLQ